GHVQSLASVWLGQSREKAFQVRYIFQDVSLAVPLALTAELFLRGSLDWIQVGHGLNISQGSKKIRLLDSSGWYLVPALKGRKKPAHVSGVATTWLTPGQRPGNVITPKSQALSGRNRNAFQYSLSRP